MTNLPDVLECECGISITSSIFEEIQEKDDWRWWMLKEVHGYHHFHRSPLKKPFVHIIENRKEWENDQYQIEMYCECHPDFAVREYVDRSEFVLT